MSDFGMQNPGKIQRMIINNRNEYFVVYALLSFIDFVTVWIRRFMCYFRSRKS